MVLLLDNKVKLYYWKTIILFTWIYNSPYFANKQKIFQKLSTSINYIIIIGCKIMKSVQDLSKTKQI